MFAYTVLVVSVVTALITLAMIGYALRVKMQAANARNVIAREQVHERALYPANFLLVLSLITGSSAVPTFLIALSMLKG